MRVSTRLDDERTRKLEYLRSATRLGTREILERAIDTYFDQVHSARPAEIFRHTGFVGCARGDVDLSEKYKEELVGFSLLTSRSVMIGG